MILCVNDNILTVKSNLFFPGQVVASGGTGPLDFSLTESSDLYIDGEYGFIYAFTSDVDTVGELCTQDGCTAKVTVQDEIGGIKDIQVNCLILAGPFRPEICHFLSRFMKGYYFAKHHILILLCLE